MKVIGLPAFQVYHQGTTANSGHSTPRQTKSVFLHGHGLVVHTGFHSVVSTLFGHLRTMLVKREQYLWSVGHPGLEIMVASSGDRLGTNHHSEPLPETLDSDAAGTPQVQRTIFGSKGPSTCRHFETPVCKALGVVV